MRPRNVTVHLLTPAKAFGRACRRPRVAVALTLAALAALAAGRAALVFHATPSYNKMYSESLVRFRYAEMVMAGKQVPARDYMLGWPEGFRRDEMILPLPDYLVGLSYRAWRAAFGEVDPYVYLRYFMAAYGALYVPAAFLLFAVMFRRSGVALAAAAIYSTCLPTFLRAAGTYLREDFATPPLLAATALTWLLLEREPARRRPRLIAAAGLAAATFIALSCWHMAQFYLNLLLGITLLAALLGRRGRYGLVGAAFFAGTVAAAAVNKPLLVKGVLWSPTTAAALALAAWAAARGRWPRVGRPALLGLVAALVGTSLLLAGGGAYGHAYALLWAKLRYLGARPDDPLRLAAAARIFWMGPYDTTSPQRALVEYGPLLLAVAYTLARTIIPARRGRARPTRLSFFPAAMTAATATLYGFVVRLTIFFAPWAAALAVFPAATARRRRTRLASWATVLGLIAFQVYWAFFYQRPTWYRRLLNIAPATERPVWNYGAEDSNVFAWLRENTPPAAAVLAQFGISASVMYWGKRPAVLHPMFEAPAIRPKIIEASRALMRSEEDLYRFCRQRRISYVLFNAPVFLVYEPPGDRYFAATPTPAADAVSRKMQFAPETLTLFRLVHETYSMRVFEVGRPYDGYRARRYHPYFDVAVFGDVPTREHYYDVAREIRRAGEHYDVATALESRHSFTAAAREYALALKLHADYEDAQMRLGYCLVQLGRLEEAAPHFRRALRVDPENATAHTYMGSYYFVTGDLTAALHEYRRAYELAPDDADNAARLRLLEKAMAGSQPARSAFEAYAPRP